MIFRAQKSVHRIEKKKKTQIETEEAKREYDEEAERGIQSWRIRGEGGGATNSTSRSVLARDSAGH